jgi:hypothetical protein
MILPRGAIPASGGDVRSAPGNADAEHDHDATRERRASDHDPSCLGSVAADLNIWPTSS